MLRIYQPNVLPVFTEPQNLQVQKLCSIPSSPQTPQVHHAGEAGPVTCVWGCGGPTHPGPHSEAGITLQSEWLINR